MSEEIKEILDNTLEYLEGIDETRNTKILTTNETYILLDYITNLHKKVEQLEERCEYLERSNNRREDEIIELRNENVDLVSKNKQLEKENKEIYETQKEYGCRILDACDFIEQRINNKEFDYIRLSMNEIVYLLNILNKGSNKE